MTPEELALMEEVQQEVAECLGVSKAFGDQWVGRFQLKLGRDNRDCELYSSVLHIGDDVLRLMSHQVLDTAVGRTYLVDFFSSDYIARIIRIFDTDIQKMTTTIGITIGGVVQSTEVVDITFVKE